MVFFKKEFDPVVTMTTAHDRLRDGDLTARVDESMVGDEFLSLYSRLNVFSVNQ